VVSLHLVSFDLVFLCDNLIIPSLSPSKASLLLSSLQVVNKLIVLSLSIPAAASTFAAFELTRRSDYSLCVKSFKNADPCFCRIPRKHHRGLILMEVFDITIWEAFVTIAAMYSPPKNDGTLMSIARRVNKVMSAYFQVTSSFLTGGFS
jgi:hypothetical protein